MTLSTTANIMQYSGNGVTTAFSFPYLFYADADLKVYIDSDLQASGYTVSGAGVAGGGSVTFSTAPLTGTTVTIQRLVDVTQETDFENFDGNPADVTEKQFDLCVMMSQQNADSTFRSLKYPATISGITDASLPTPIDGTALVFDGTTGAITTSTTYIADAVSDATAAVTGTALITATSTTSLATTGSGNKTWVIQSGRGFALGQRLRVASDDGTKINEGVVTSYSDTSLIINVDYVSGSGTHADWNISVAGDRGASGGGTGDMLAAQNLNDVASKPTAFNTIKQAATDANSGVVELATDAETITGTDTVRAVTPAGLKAALNLPFLHLQDQKISGTEGGGFTSGAWRTRVLNTEVTDTIGSTLSSNQFTLPAGTYYFEASAPAFSVGRHLSRLQNITDTTTTLLGTSEVTASSTSVVTRSFVNGQFTIADTKTFELQHRCQATNGTNGFGGATGFDTEVYAEVRVWKVV